jgi:hypothetical protein
MIGDLLEKLSKKTGREWTMVDLMRLAQKLPELNQGNVDAVFQELGEMGLELPEEIKEKVKGKLSGGQINQEQVTETINDLTNQKRKKPEKKRKSRIETVSRKKKRK